MGYRIPASYTFPPKILTRHRPAVRHGILCTTVSNPGFRSMGLM